MKNKVKIQIEAWTTEAGIHTESRMEGSAALAVQALLCAIVGIVEENHKGNPMESVNGLCEILKEIAEKTLKKEDTANANLPN